MSMQQALRVVVYGITFILLAAYLSGCETAGRRDPETRTVEVLVPVSKPCVDPATPQPPDSYSDDGVDQLGDPVERVRRRAAGLQERKARLAILEPVVAACR